MKIIDIRKATVYRGANRVFADLSLAIESGCQTALLGPNGAGKSTLIQLLSGEIHPASREGASIRLFGLERWNVWELRARLGIVSHDLQHRYLDGARGVEVILSAYYASIGLYPYQRFSSEQMKRARDVMEILGVAPIENRRFIEMSAGEQRRFLLGRALVHDPQTLLLDEPTGGLDLQACFHYLQLVRDLIAGGKTVILATHHLHEIPPEITRIILLKGGRVVADGRKTEILTGERLTALFDTPIELLQANGWYQAVPAK